MVIKGPNVMRGYLNRPEETAKTIVDGWLHTGDVGRFDEDGYLVLVDRAKDMIIRGGENIYPREIEAVAHGLPQIAEAAVVGRTHPVYGEEPVLFVSLHPDATLDAAAIREHLSGSLSKYKLPVGDHDHGRPPQECRRQDRQARAAPAADARLKQPTPDPITNQRRRANHGIHQAGPARGRSGHIPAEAADGANAHPGRRLGRKRFRLTARWSTPSTS